MKYKATLIIPVFDEIRSLEKFCNKIKNTFSNIKLKYIFVDDGSRDGSTEWLNKNLKRKFPIEDFEFIKLNKNYGKGYSIKKGIERMVGDYVLFIDSDLEYDPDDLLTMYNVILENNEIEVIYGSRNLGSKTQLRRYFLNGIAVKINTWIFNFLFKQHLTDLHTGSKIIKKNLLKDIKITSNGFGLEIDLSGEIAKKNINIFEYGISYFERSVDEGKKITFTDGILSYFYLFKSRFIRNNIDTQITLIYSFFIFLFLGLMNEQGVTKILFGLFFPLAGLILALNRKIISISIIAFFLYIGKLFIHGSMKVYLILSIYFLSIFLSDLLIKKLLKLKKYKNLNFFI